MTDLINIAGIHLQYPDYPAETLIDISRYLTTIYQFMNTKELLSKNNNVSSYKIK